MLPAPFGGHRIVRLCRAVVALARERGINVEVYAKTDVQACFSVVGARSRQEIAAAVARSYALLEDRLPAPRKPWHGPHPRMALFDAAAAVITHYQRGAFQLFDDLRPSPDSDAV